MISSDGILEVLKSLGAAVTGVLGLVGVLYDFKGPDKRLTRAGVWVVAGICTSTVVSVGTSIVEGYKAKADAADQSARTAKLLGELARAQQPITMVHVYCWLEIDPASNELTLSFMNTISESIEKRMVDIRHPVRPENTGLSVVSFDDNYDPIDIGISDKSDLWPQGKYEFLSAMLRSLWASVSVHRTPASPPFDPNCRDCDLWGAVNTQTTPHLDWNIRQKRLYIVVDVTIDRRHWNIVTGKVTSILDLPGSQIILYFPDHAYLADYKHVLPTTPRTQLAASLKLDIAKLTFAEGQEIWLHREQVSTLHYENGEVFFVTTLPSDDTEFKKITSSWGR